MCVTTMRCPGTVPIMLMTECDPTAFSAAAARFLCEAGIHSRAESHRRADRPRGRILSVTRLFASARFIIQLIQLRGDNNNNRRGKHIHPPIVAYSSRLGRRVTFQPPSCVIRGGYTRTGRAWRPSNTWRLPDVGHHADDESRQTAQLIPVCRRSSPVDTGRHKLTSTTSAHQRPSDGARSFTPPVWRVRFMHSVVPYTADGGQSTL